MSPGDGHKSDSAATVRVVVVNFNAGRELLACAKSVLEQRQGVTLTVIDNASTDDSMQILDSSTPADSVACARSTQPTPFGHEVSAL